MAAYLGLPTSDDLNQDRLIVAELNKLKIAFHVHHVSRIHRVSWNQIEKPSDMVQNIEGIAIGMVKLEDRIIILLDYEKIVVDINPAIGIHVDRLKTLGPRERSNKKIIVAEDSALLRTLIEQTLHEAGYDNLTFFSDGQMAWDYLSVKGKADTHLVITDIEMPQMDGHHLTKKIKEHQALKHLPVIIFSSLISDGLKHKGESVGACAQVSKPEIEVLVQKIDSYIL